MFRVEENSFWNFCLPKTVLVESALFGVGAGWVVRCQPQITSRRSPALHATVLLGGGVQWAIHVHLQLHTL